MNKDYYSKMTTEEFDEILQEVMNEEASPAALLSIPGIYEIVVEYYNNDVLDRWVTTREASQSEPTG